jgi:hypothetical protein
MWLEIKFFIPFPLWLGPQVNTKKLSKLRYESASYAV